jgi:hypothetical protein
MHPLTKNFQCWIAKDGQHFTVHNKANDSGEGGYELGAYARFEDAGVKYKVTIRADAHSDIGIVDLQRVEEEK